jgi:hypothetical protein
MPFSHIHLAMLFKVVNATLLTKVLLTNPAPAILGAILALMLPLAANAEPDPIFLPHLSDIAELVPPGFPLRLPTQVRFSRYASFDPSKLIVKSFGSRTPLSLNVSLFSCDKGPEGCFVGSVTTERASSSSARAELDRLRKSGYPVTLRRDIRAYVIDGFAKTPVAPFSAIAWQQDDAIYILNFQSGDKDGLIAMARSMVQSEALRPTLPPIPPASRRRLTGPRLY